MNYTLSFTQYGSSCSLVFKNRVLKFDLMFRAMSFDPNEIAFVVVTEKSIVTNWRNCLQLNFNCIDSYDLTVSPKYWL